MHLFRKIRPFLPGAEAIKSRGVRKIIKTAVFGVLTAVASVRIGWEEGTPERTATCAQNKNDERPIRLRNMSWNIGIWTGFRPRKSACSNGGRKIIQLLLLEGASITCCTKNHTNAASRRCLAFMLYEKSYKSCFKRAPRLHVVRKIIQMLLQEGVSLTCCTKNRTNAASRRRLAFMLYEKSYNCCFKRAPRFHVVRKVIQMLLQEGASLTCCTKNHTNAASRGRLAFMLYEKSYK